MSSHEGTNVHTRNGFAKAAQRAQRRRFGGRRVGACAGRWPAVWGLEPPNARFRRHFLKCRNRGSSSVGVPRQKSLQGKHLPERPGRPILGEGEEVDNFSTHSD